MNHYLVSPLIAEINSTEFFLNSSIAEINCAVFFKLRRKKNQPHISDEENVDYYFYCQ